MVKSVGGKTQFKLSVKEFVIIPSKILIKSFQSGERLKVIFRLNYMFLMNGQGSHSDWKTWKNGKAFSSQGKVREF